MSQGDNALALCRHRWQNCKPTYFDKRHWMIIRTCRRCDRSEQLDYAVEAVDGTLKTTIRTTWIQKTVT